MIVRVLREMCAGGLFLHNTQCSKVCNYEGAEGSPQAAAQSWYTDFRAYTSFCSSFIGIVTVEDKLIQSKEYNQN